MADYESLNIHPVAALEPNQDFPAYAVYCFNASAAVYLYNCIRINADAYIKLIEASHNGYAMWMYSGAKRLDKNTLQIINKSLDHHEIPLRARIEPLVFVEGLGRRSHIGTRHVLRIEPPGLIDLTDAATDDMAAETSDFYASAAKTLDRIAVWHMSYADVDEYYDLGYRKLMGMSTRYTCSIIREGKTVLNIG
jgi:hypothetical protein